MYLKTLTLRGFKSFASSTTFHFEPGITCVVGPNGSGKSNVVDALSWVMGEQGAKSLRGGKMEDVIFAGTSGRAPLGRAEVLLTIDNADGALPIEYSEVTISRTMFRTGGSEYAINGHAARLLDIQELLSDSGIGSEMHVIVGQGQLDAILQATPETRRGFIEEAAGVLKHRKRKEKALRKLDATEANLQRLVDVISEIRRQLKPLARQAEVARKAGVVQAELLDAKARLLADDLFQAQTALAAEQADQEAVRNERQRVEAELVEARAAEESAEAALAAARPRLSAAQDVWYGLSALRERVLSTRSIAAERMRHAEALPIDDRPGRDPDTLDHEAAEVGREEGLLRAEVDRRATALTDASLHRAGVEQRHAEAERVYSAQLRAVADRREGLARLGGQVASLRSRTEAAAEQIERLAATRDGAAERAADATRRFAALESTIAGLDEGEMGLDGEYEVAAEAVEALTAEIARIRDSERAAASRKMALAARVEALRGGLEREDAGAALVTAGSLDGLLGPLAKHVSVRQGYEAAVSAALGTAVEAITVSDLSSARGAIDQLRTGDLGRATMLVAGAVDAGESWPPLPAGVVYVADAVEVYEPFRAAFRSVVRLMVVVDDLDAAERLVQDRPELVAVTRDGDVLSSWYAAGGTGRQSVLQVQAAVNEAEEALAAVTHEVERHAFALAQATAAYDEAKRRLDVALAHLNESDAKQAALAEELGQLNQRARAARGEHERLAAAIADAEANRAKDLAALADMTARLELASADGGEVEADPSVRDRLADEARAARSAEMDARLALRTMEERVRALSGRAEALRKAAVAERQARERAEARREQLRIEGEAARAVHAGATYLLLRLEASRVLAQQERDQADAVRADAEEVLMATRAAARTLTKTLEGLVDDSHREELARAQQRMRIDALADRALSEVGIEPDTLVAEYGPHAPVPVIVHPDGTPIGPDDEVPEPIPYVRDDQLRRLRAAERNLQVLGRVNPLALEEFDAMQERHTFLAEQLEDLRRTRVDLQQIVNEVDARVQEVFAAAYEDVEREFEIVFARLFPGGEGRLLLTEPGAWLTTGVEVEARPAGKKVKRLSLLSGGERSLVAVAFLVALFRARPSPFYILDEVEAALDDTNLGRLLEIYSELRETSQLLVITHQKRTMEVADSLYGVTMRSDGVSTVISQRLREA